jgi:rod shape-determining protein MreC
MKPAKERQFSWTRTLYLLVALVLVSLALILLSQGRHLEPVERIVSGVFTPIQRAVSDATTNVGNWFGSLGRGPALEEENRRLRAALEQQMSENTTLQERRRENEQLKSMLKFQTERPEISAVEARFIGGDPSGQMEIMTIDRGTTHGLTEGMPVVSPSGVLVGQIAAAKSERATVLLITDSSSSIPVETQRNAVPGILEGKWQEGGRLLARRLPRDADVLEGDLLITSGVGDTFPRGLLVGQVSRLRQGDVQMEKEAEAYPIADLENLESILVITK